MLKIYNSKDSEFDNTINIINKSVIIEDILSSIDN